jgi:biotin carboxyl carrier protein
MLTDSSVDIEPGSTSITSSLSASIWKIKCQPGDVIQSGDDILVILEVMKTDSDRDQCSCGRRKCWKGSENFW